MNSRTVAMAVLAGVAFALACGRASRSPRPAATGGEGTTPMAGKSPASGGVPGEGGRGDADGGGVQSGGTNSGAGGTSGTGGAASGTAGVDVTEGDGGGTAGMDATLAGAGGADECSRTHAPCFEPCGGDVIGNWILEAGCLRGGELGEGCMGGSIEGTLLEANLRLSIDESGRLSVSGSEPWNLLVHSPRSCLSLDGSEPCDRGVLFTSALLFASSRHLVSCQLEACGSCECSGLIDGGLVGALTWTSAGSQLTLKGSQLQVPDTTVPYCVQGDELWLGGGDTNGHTKVAYKFRKRSCTETLPPCNERTFSECETKTDCRWGACLRSSDRSGFCEGLSDFQCAAPDCVWDPNQCGATGIPSCNFHDCELTPGCVLGPPVARCAGSAWCGFDVNQCFEPGCFVSSCAALNDNIASCEHLDSESCRLAQGCSFDDVSCEGTTRCWDQTNDDVCGRLYCDPKEHCAGVPTRRCSELSVSDCETLPGCRVEW